MRSYVGPFCSAAASVSIGWKPLVCRCVKAYNATRVSALPDRGVPAAAASGRGGGFGLRHGHGHSGAKAIHSAWRKRIIMAPCHDNMSGVSLWAQA